MKIDQLRYFLETARHGHIGKASNVLAISPSAISHSIAALEEELGRELFLKKGKNIVLTSHGKLLMERARKLLQDVDAVKDEVASDSVELQGHYRLAATHVLCSRFLAPTWTKIQSANPRLSAEIYSLRSAAVVAAVAGGEFDFGLCLSPQPHPSLNMEQVSGGQLVIVVGKKHPVLKLEKRARFRALSSYPASLAKAFQGIDNCESHPIFEKYGIVPDVRFAFDSYDVAVENVTSSQSWALVPCWVLRSHRDRLAAVWTKGWEAPLTTAAIWPKNRLLTKAMRRLIDGIRARFKSLPEFRAD